MNLHGSFYSITVRANLHGTTLSRAIFVAHAACIVYNFHHLTMTVATKCRMVLKHGLKFYDIFRVVYISHNVFIDMIYLWCNGEMVQCKLKSKSALRNVSNCLVSAHKISCSRWLLIQC